MGGGGSVVLGRINSFGGVVVEWRESLDNSKGGDI